MKKTWKLIEARSLRKFVEMVMKAIFQVQCERRFMEMYLHVVTSSQGRAKMKDDEYTPTSIIEHKTCKALQTLVWARPP